MKHGHRFLIGALVTLVLVAALALLAVGGEGARAQGTIIYVDADATGGANNGTSWADAFLDLQDALDVAGSGDQIWVAEGTYKPRDEVGGTGDRYKTFQLINGVAIYGGFDPPVDDTWEERNLEDNVTVLSGDIGIAGDPSDNSYHVFYHPSGLSLDSTAILAGFTVTSGNADGAIPHNYGGGMFNEGSSPALTNMIFASNSASGGGGMYNDAASSPVLTGCMFEGNSSGSGGGIKNHNSSPTLIDCTFSGNSATSGGGMMNWSSSPVLTGCTFLSNQAVNGGGMYNEAGSAPMLTGCTFSSHSVNGHGGGMMNYGASPWLAGCTFEGNSAHMSGGGMCNVYSSPRLIGCTFVGNSTEDPDTWGGGGMYNDLESSPTLTNCTFEDNLAGAYGGGMLNWRSSSPVLGGCTFEGNGARWGGGMANSESMPTLNKCTFAENAAIWDGGGMFNDGASPVLTNCTFLHNFAGPGSAGGGMFNSNGSSPTLTNCTFSRNTYALYGTGGGMANNSSSPVLANCILWGDKSPEISNVSSSPLVTYSDVQGGYAGVGNINVDPLFVDSYNGDLHLGTGSPCIDAGSNAAANLPLRDFDGDPRIMDGDSNGTAVVDMGADELWVPPPPVIYVDQDATGINSGRSWADAFTNLQLALDWAVAGVEIWVAEGTYKPTVARGGYGDRFRSFQMVNGVAMYGGFDPTVGDVGWGDRDWESNVTVLSGDLNGDDVPPFANNDENSYHVFFHPWELALDSSAILDGFTITGGNANLAPDDSLHNRGGGMFNNTASPVVTNCSFEGNSAYEGGGMYNVEDSMPQLLNCSFSGNSAGYRGGGMANQDGSSPMLTGCSFTNNTSNYHGGGMVNDTNSMPTLTGCSFTGNSAGYYGGGMQNRVYSSPALADCTFSNNSAGQGGGGVSNDSYCSPTLSNVTFSGNTGGVGGGMFNINSSAPELNGCTFAANSAELGGGVYNSTSSPTLSDCTFAENSADYDGGGMWNDESSPTLTNVAFWRNWAGNQGGGMWNLESSPTVTNCTFWGNITEGTGGGVYLANSSPVLTNCILWGDTPDEIVKLPGSFPAITYSDVEGGYAGMGNLDLDPLFVDAANGDLHLGTGSPCIDEGNNAAPNLPSYDFEGDLRIQDGDGDGTATVDMGMDETPDLFVPSPMEINIDITPNTPSNIIRLSSPAKVPVAILSDEDLDAPNHIIPESVVFAGAPIAGLAVQDVDNDGDLDLVVSFYPADMVDLTLTSKTATLTAQRYNASDVEGTDKVKVRE